MGDYTPVNNVDSISLTASATITGGQLVTASGNGTCAPSTTNDHSVGVALHDAVNGQRVSVAVLPGAVHEVLIQGVLVLAAGNPVVAGTAGSIGPGSTLGAAAAAGTLIGICTVGGTGGSGSGKARFVGV